MLPSFPAANKENVISLPVRPINCSPIAREKNLCEKNGNEDDGTRIKGFHMSSAAHVHTHAFHVGARVRVIFNRWGLTECWFVSAAQMQLGHVLVAPEQHRKWLCLRKITTVMKTKKRKNNEGWQESLGRKKWLSSRRWVRSARSVSPYVFNWDVIFFFMLFYVTLLPHKAS